MTEAQSPAEAPPLTSGTEASFALGNLNRSGSPTGLQLPALTVNGSPL